MCVSKEPHTEWHHLHKWLPCLLQRSRVIPDWPLLSKPRHTSHATPALKCNTPVVSEPICTARLPPRQTSAVPDRLLPSLRLPGEHKQLPESFLRMRPHCKCQMLWKWLKSAWHQRTIRWKQHSGDWLTSWLIVCRAAAVRRVMKHLFSSTPFHLIHFKRGPILRNCSFHFFNAYNYATCPPTHAPHN